MWTYSLLFLRLTQRRRRPAYNDRVDRVRAHGEDEARHVAARSVERAGCDDEADDRDEQADGDVPCALVHSSGAPAREDAGDASEDEGRAGQDEGDGAVEAECFDDTIEIVSSTLLVCKES